MNTRDDRIPHRNRTDRSSLRRSDSRITPIRSTSVKPKEELPPKQNISTRPEDLARTRKDFGFDDIPVDDEDMENVRFRDILKAWSKQAIKHSPLEDKINKAAKSSRLKELKNDLKWAMQADLDEPVKTSKKRPEPLPPPSPAPDKARDTKPPVQSPAAQSKTIDININFGSLPKLPRPTRSTGVQRVIQKVRAFRWTRRRIIIAVTLLILVAAFLTWRFAPEIIGGKAKSNSIDTTNISQKPEYTTLLPGGKSIESLGGWHRVSPPDRSPVFAYLDKIGDVQVNVSQQPLPDSFKTETGSKVADLAKSFNATEKIEVDGLTVYIGSSAKGPQSVILAKGDTLILMKSQTKISNESWADYVKSLK